MLTRIFSRDIGQHAEKYALRYLQKQGLKKIACNFHSRYGEIDLIMRDNLKLVFIEVKYRKNLNYGQPEEWVNHTKQQKIILTAEYFLQKHAINQNYSSIRFDIIAINGTIPNLDINWIKHAFLC